MAENKCAGCLSIEHGKCTTGSDCKFYSEANIKEEVRRRDYKELVRILDRFPSDRKYIEDIKTKYRDRGDVSDLLKDIHFLIGTIALIQAEKNKMVNVVLCDDCIHADEDRYCSTHGIFVDKDNYCSWGETKEE